MRIFKYNFLTFYQFYLVYIMSSPFILFPLHLNAQNKTNDILTIGRLEQIRGIYDTKKQTYYGQFIDQNNIKIIHRFESKRINNGVGIVEYYYTNTESGFKSRIKKGLIDTSGIILIPCNYDKLLPTENKNFYVFYNQDSTGLLRVDKGVIVQLPIKTGIYYNGFFSNQTNVNYCVVRMNNAYGVFSFFKEKLVVPAEYSEINLVDHKAICQLENNFVVHDCEKELKSQSLKEIYPLNKGKYYFLRFMNGRALICTDPISPDSSICEKLNREAAIEFHNNYVISKFNDKIGLLDEYGNETVPYVYEDIYFFDKELLLVKYNNLWAISDYKNSILSEFQFINVDQQNQINLKNFIQFSGIDTSDYAITKSINQKPGKGQSEKDLLSIINLETIILKRELFSHKLSRCDNFVYPRYVLQSKDGFQIITVLSKNRIKIDSLIWDSVFMVPGVSSYSFEIGVQKGKKFGYYDPQKRTNEYLKYDGIYYCYKLFFYESIMFSGTHNEGSPFTIVKRGYVFRQSSYSKTNWLKRITTPPNWPAKYQEKPKWRKYMKVEEFLQKRKENSVS